MNKVVVGHSNRIVFDEVKRGDDSEMLSLRVSVELEDLTASRRITPHYANAFDDLRDFFEDLAAHWTGWTGSKHYESLERDLNLRAEHNGHIQLMFILEDPSFPEEWSVRGKVTLEPGEELTRVSEDIRLLLGP
jgi:Family of unknown function (DUF6228)